MRAINRRPIWLNLAVVFWLACSIELRAQQPSAATLGQPQPPVQDPFNRQPDPWIGGGQTFTVQEVPATLPPPGKEDLRSRIQEQRNALIKSLQELQDTYCRAAMLDEALAVREQIRRLQSDAETRFPNVQAAVQPAPAMPRALVPKGVWVMSTILPDGSRMLAASTNSNWTFTTPAEVQDQIGEVFYARAVGRPRENLWGSGTYTADSDIGAAAMHSGFLKLGEQKIVRFKILPGEDRYEGSKQNDVTSQARAAYRSSFRIEGAADIVQDRLTSFRNSDEKLLTLFVVGKTTGAVWGDTIYTDDSDVAAAAVHDGLVEPGKAAFVVVELMEGQSSYFGTSRNGVTTQPYGNWERSFQFKPFEPPEEKQVPSKTSVFDKF